MPEELLAAMSEAAAEVIEDNEGAFIVQVRVGDHFRRNFIFCQAHHVHCVTSNEDTARRWAKNPALWCYHCGRRS